MARVTPNAAPALSAAATQARATRTRALLEAPIAPTLAKLAAPNVLAMFVQTVQSISEAYFASLLGVTALAGLALVFPLVMLTQMLSAPLVGRSRPRWRAHLARKTAHGRPHWRWSRG